MPSSSIPVPDRDLGNSPSSRKSNVEDLRRHNNKLKSDLEAERAKVRQVLRDKSAELKRIQDGFEKEKQRAIELATKRLLTEHATELKKARDNTAKEKDNELRQVLKFKEEEVKTMRQQITDEKEKNRHAEEELRRVLVDRSKEGEDHSEVERKLRNEIATLKEQKQKAEEIYRAKCSADNEKAELIRRLKADHELELQKFVKDSKRESIHSLQQRRLTEKALEEKEHELAYKDHLAKKLEAEKDDLQRKLSGDVEMVRRSSLRTGAPFDLGASDRLDESPVVRKDKERELKKKNAELQSKVESLEKKCAVLEKEMSKSGNLKATFVAEEKIKKLKKRNSELVSIARQLEEKAKKLQEEKVQAQKLVEENSSNSAGVEHVKKMYARQRAKDLAEHAKAVLSKEKELDELRKEILPQKNGPDFPQEKVEELQSIIRQSAKERLWLERQLSNGDSSREPSPQLLTGDLASEIKKKTEILCRLEDENNNLKSSVVQLQKAEAESLKLAEELKEKEKENHKLVSDLEEKQTKCSKLEHERERFAAKCTMLQKKNAEMTKKMAELEEMEDELSNVKEKLEVSDENCGLLTDECNRLKHQLEGLLHVKEDLKTMEQQKKTIEKEHLSSVEKLKEREEEIRQLHKIQEEANRAHEMAVTSLEDTVCSLEQKCIEAEKNNINLKKEMEELKQMERNSNRRKEEICHRSTQTTLETVNKEIPAVVEVKGIAIKGQPSLEESPQPLCKLTSDATDVLSSQIMPTKSATYEAKVGSPHINSSKPQPVGREEASTKGSAAPASEDILESLASRINQLAASDSEDDPISEKAYEDLRDDQEKDEKPERPEVDFDDLHWRIDQAEAGEDTSSSISTRERACSEASQDMASMAEGDLGDLEDNQPDSSAPEDEQPEHSALQPIGKLNVHNAKPASSEDITTDTNNRFNAEEEVLDTKYLEGDNSDADPAIQEKLAVYIARYSYDPQQYSPNENPDMELAFQAGDYLYVFGEMDEDGYFLGELMNGQRGFVPSNFVEKVADEILDSSDEEETDEEESFSEGGETELAMPGENGERQMKPVRMLKFSGKLHRALRLSVEHIPDVGLQDIEEEDEEDMQEESEGEHDSENEFDEQDGSKETEFNQDGITSDEIDIMPRRVPSPRRLHLERQFTRSVLLSWKPADLSADQVKGYGVYANGELRLMIKGSNKTKALLEDIDPQETYRISVRTITTQGEESSDRSAVVTIGKDANFAPSHVHVTCISPTSAKIEWSPGNSSLSHEILLNGDLYRTVRPGTFQHTISNLEPDQLYKVHIRAKDPKRVSIADREGDIEVDLLTAEAEFRTEPGGLPDPPLDVEATPGQSNSLDVNWIPVTITNKGTSNGARVTGYKVYINGFLCTEVTSPTADCVTAVSWMVERGSKRSDSGDLRVIVRTQSCEGESADSNEVALPVDMFNFKVNQVIKPKETEQVSQRNDMLLEISAVEDYESHEGSANLANGELVSDGSRERADSVRRFSMGENGQPQVVLVEDIAKHTKDDSGPLAQPRTKGEPVVWKYEAEDESETADSITKSEGRSGSEDEDEDEDEDDEEVEICIPDDSDDKEPAVHTKTVVNVEEQGYQRLEESNDDIEAETGAPEDEQQFVEEKQALSGEEVSETQENSSRTRKESGTSLESDLDMEELGQSLEEAQNIQRTSPEGRESEDRMPYIRPLEYDESDFESESSEQAPLSIIQEEDEEDLSEEIHFPRSHSASEGFESDDDVMDLLDDEQVWDQSSGRVDFESGCKVSQREGPSAVNINKTSESQGFGKYLANSDQLRTTAAHDSPYRLVDNIKLSESEGELVDNDGIDITYSDTEADRGGLETSLTPLDGQYGEGMTREEIPQHPAYDKAAPSAEGQAPSDQGYVGEGASEEQVRVFLALYDYDPATMSPNPDAEEEELTFNEGDLIKVYGDKDEDGFYWGELNGKAGYIPFNMVSEVPLDDEESGSNVTAPYLSMTQESDTQPQSLEKASRAEETEAASNASDKLLEEVILEDGEEFEDPRASDNYQLPPRRMVALFDYDPQTLSPNPDSEVELKFRVGDIIYVYGDMDEDGFFTGELRGIRGLVPSNFLESLSDPMEESHPDTSNDSYESPVDSSDKYNSPNGTYSVPDDTPKKKKGIFSKGKQMFKKIAKGHNSPRGSSSKR
ncbi:RIMS-binding protein 2 [Stylophora pistillata]|uniref:RIMS-binding protein 2 n=1 Tax=Stylophora pistillata TaxID=50429 RepID=A0A2B4SS45_STYPI|nr:RIMS-binding protein 2 [Stylophora pistillata]